MTESSKPSHLNYCQLSGYVEPPNTEILQRARRFRELQCRRRTIRQFSNRAVPDQVIQDCLEAAGSAPSGANQQPWHFAVIRSPEIKKQIREAAEQEEREFYQHRAPQPWLDALAPLGTDAQKPFLETASHLIVVFSVTQSLDQNGQPRKHYYVSESVGIATGILITALHQAGLATLTHTPSPMAFLNKILQRPKKERPFVLLVAGFPDENATVPNIQRKTLDQISTWH